MECINSDFTQIDYNELRMELDLLIIEQRVSGVDNSKRIEEINDLLNDILGPDEE